MKGIQFVVNEAGEKQAVLIDLADEGYVDLRMSNSIKSEDEQQWDKSFHRTQSALVAAARRAKQERAAGKAMPMNYEEL